MNAGKGELKLHGQSFPSLQPRQTQMLCPWTAKRLPCRQESYLEMSLQPKLQLTMTQMPQRQWLSICAEILLLLEMETKRWTSRLVCGAENMAVHDQ